MLWCSRLLLHHQCKSARLRYLVVWEYPALCQDATEEWQEGGFWVQVCVAFQLMFRCIDCMSFSVCIWGTLTWYL